MVVCIGSWTDEVFEGNFDVWKEVGGHQIVRLNWNEKPTVADFFERPTIELVECPFLADVEPTFCNPFEKVHACLFDMNTDMRGRGKHRRIYFSWMRTEED